VETDRQRGQWVEVVDLQLVHLQVGQNHRLRSRRRRGRVDLLGAEKALLADLLGLFLVFLVFLVLLVLLALLALLVELPPFNRTQGYCD